MEASHVSRDCIGSRRIDRLYLSKSQVAGWRRRAERDGRLNRWNRSSLDER
jgi:hypothetical protein